MSRDTFSLSSSMGELGSSTGNVGLYPLFGGGGEKNSTKNSSYFSAIDGIASFVFKIESTGGSRYPKISFTRKTISEVFPTSSTITMPVSISGAIASRRSISSFCTWVLNQIDNLAAFSIPSACILSSNRADDGVIKTSASFCSSDKSFRILPFSNISSNENDSGSTVINASINLPDPVRLLRNISKSSSCFNTEQTIQPG